MFKKIRGATEQAEPADLLYPSPSYILHQYENFRKML